MSFVLFLHSFRNGNVSSVDRIEVRATEVDKQIEQRSNDFNSPDGQKFLNFRL